MSPTVLPTRASAGSARPARARGLPGFFAVVFAVNGAMIYSALSTYTGLVATSPIARACTTTSASPRTSARRARLDRRRSTIGRDGRVRARARRRATAAPVARPEDRGRARPARPPTATTSSSTLARRAPGRYEAQTRALLGRGHLAGRARSARGQRTPSRSTARGGAYGSSPERRPHGVALAMRARRQDRRPHRRPRRRWPSRTCIAAAACAKSRRRWPPCPALPARAPTCPRKRVTAVHAPAGVNAADLVDALDRAGFTAAELADDAASDRPRATDRDFLERIGVAGFAAANIMLLSVSVWSGARRRHDARRCRRCSTGSRR